MKNCWFIKRIVSRNIQQDIWQYCVWTYLECFFVFWKYSLFSTQYIISILKNFSHFSEILSVYFIYIPVSKLTSRFLTNFIKHKLNQHYPIKSIIYRLLANISTGFEINNFNGIKICVSGRFTRKERKLFYWKSYKKIGYSDINTKLDYNLTTIILKNSICGIKVWSNQGVKLNNLFIF